MQLWTKDIVQFWGQKVKVQVHLFMSLNITITDSFSGEVIARKLTIKDHLVLKLVRTVSSCFISFNLVIFSSKLSCFFYFRLKFTWCHYWCFLHIYCVQLTLQQERNSLLSCAEEIQLLQNMLCAIGAKKTLDIGKIIPLFGYHKSGVARLRVWRPHTLLECALRTTHF